MEITVTMNSQHYTPNMNLIVIKKLPIYLKKKTIYYGARIFLKIYYVI